MRRFVSIDVETTGLNPFVHETIEVGLVIETAPAGSPGGFNVEEVEFSLPFDESKADPEALKVNGWGKRPFAPMKDPAWAAGHLCEVLADAHLIAQNPHFDQAFITMLLRHYGFGPTWHHRIVDIGALAWGHHNGDQIATNGIHGAFLHEPPNVAKVEEITEIPVGEEDRHTALGDARWAYRVFRSIVPVP